ncbi:hypothetical protein ACVIGB_005240 [Bradyrhizobium sp. USDA 4341]
MNNSSAVRILVVIPHFFRGTDPNATNRSTQPQARRERLHALSATISSLHQTFGSSTYGLDHFQRSAWQAAPHIPHVLDIVVCTTGNAHLLDENPYLRTSCRHHAAEVDPLLLGFECHRLLANARGRYDFFCYVEDDIVVSDPLFFRKRTLFDRQFGPDVLLQPNRYEIRPDGPVKKLYVDYHLAPGLTSTYQDVAREPELNMLFLEETIVFQRTSYPSAGCFFLNSEQLARWVDSPAFCDGDVSYLSPLDSAVTLSVMKTFRIYKAALDQAWFLEVLHTSPRWVASATQLTRLVPRDGALSPHLTWTGA